MIVNKPLSVFRSVAKRSQNLFYGLPQRHTLVNMVLNLSQYFAGVGSRQGTQLGLQLGAARFGEGVVFSRVRSVVENAPFRRNESAFFKSVQQGIERALGYL